jgi:hypothetical protein
VPDNTAHADGVRTGHEPSGTPRWVKVFWIVLAVLAVALVVLMLFAGRHGPGRHASSGAALSGDVPPAGGLT